MSGFDGDVWLLCYLVIVIRIYSADILKCPPDSGRWLFLVIWFDSAVMQSGVLRWMPPLAHCSRTMLCTYLHLSQVVNVGGGQGSVHFASKSFSLPTFHATISITLAHILFHLRWLVLWKS
jgi:hypothetical protein